MSTGYNRWHHGKATLPEKRWYLIAQDTGAGAGKRYMACDSYEYMMGRLADICNGYEVVDVMACPVWLFCDYDGDKGDVKFTDQQVREALSSLIRGVIKEEFGDATVREYCSSATTLIKTSIHIKMDVLFGDVHALKDFMLKVEDRAIKNKIPEFMSCDPKRDCLIDVSVYTNFRCYRCVGMTKYGQDNELKCMDGHSAEDHQIRYYPESPMTPSILVKELGPPGARFNSAKRQARLLAELEGVEGEQHHSVLQRYGDYINSFECIVDKLGASVVLSKITSMGENITCCSIKKDYRHVCPVAGRTHDSNNLYALVNMHKKTITVRCHDEECKGKNGIVAKAYDNTNAYDRGDVTSMHSQEGNIMWSEYYNADEMRDYPLQPIVCVRAGMGTGKTQALKRLAATFDKDTKALIVTHSRALAHRMHSEFEGYGFVNYEKADTDIVDAKVVVCLDSIARVRTSAFSFVFLDEAVSLFLHLNSPLMGNKTSLNLSVLELAIIQAKHVYFLDACMDHTFGKSVVDFFADQKGCTPYWIRNAYIRPSNRVMYTDIVPADKANIVTKSSQLSRAIKKVLDMLIAGKNVVVCTSSKSFTVRLQNFILKMRPDTRMIVYNSDSQEKTNNVSEYWKTCQLLVYSPTITAGVSFEEPHFDSLVAFLSNSHFAPTVDMALQQLFRVRNLKDGDMHIYIHQMDTDQSSEDALPYPITKDDIIGFLQSDISLASKYFSTHKVNVQSVYRPSKDMTLQYDVDRLSFLIIVGILMMRNRSTVHYSTLLMDTLHFDYGIPAKDMDEEAVELTQTQLDALKAAPDKVPPVPFKDVYPVMHLVDYKDTKLPADVLRAARHLVNFSQSRWNISPTLDEETLQSFYAEISCSNAMETFHRAQRFIALCDHTLEENKTELARSMHHALDDSDPNIVLFKKRLHAYHMKIILGTQYLHALGNDKQANAVKSCGTMEVNETKCLETYMEMMDSMPAADASYFKKLFEIKSATGFMVAKWILGGAFGLDVYRRCKKANRPKYDLIVIEETCLRGMQESYGVDLRRKNICRFRPRPKMGES